MIDTKLTSISAETLADYRETEFRVLGNAPTILFVGQPSAELAELHRAQGVDCSTFVTACNPRGEAFGEAENAERQAALATDLRHRSLRFVDAIGQHPFNDWPGEPSFLVFGLTLEAAKALGKRLEQNAIVWAGADAVPGLVLLR